MSFKVKKLCIPYYKWFARPAPIMGNKGTVSFRSQSTAITFSNNQSTAILSTLNDNPKPLKEVSLMFYLTNVEKSDSKVKIQMNATSTN